MLLDEFRGAALMFAERMGIDPRARMILSQAINEDASADIAVAMKATITQSGLDSANQIIMALSICHYTTNQKVDRAMRELIDTALPALALETEAGRNALPYATASSIRNQQIGPEALAEMVAHKIDQAPLPPEDKYELTDMTLSYTEAGHPLRKRLVGILDAINAARASISAPGLPHAPGGMG
jgi:hypothetical protein